MALTDEQRAALDAARATCPPWAKVVVGDGYIPEGALVMASDDTGDVVYANDPEPDRAEMVDEQIGGEPPGVAVLENVEPAKMLADALRENLSPLALACIWSYLQACDPPDAVTACQVRWFEDMLIDILGGAEEGDRLCDEAGV